MDRSSHVGCPSCESEMILKSLPGGNGEAESYFVCERAPKCMGMLPASPRIGPDYEGIAKETTQQLLKKDEPLSGHERTQLVTLLTRLLDRTARSRSIRLKRLNKKWTFDLSSLNEFGAETGKEILQHCLVSKSSISILPKAKIPKTREKVEKLSSNLTALHRSINEIHKEKGLYDLYIGFPFVSGIPASSGEIVQGPVFLLPVTLEKTIAKGGTINWTLRANELPIFFNKALLMTIAKLRQKKINDEMFEEEIPTDLNGETSFISKTHSLLNQYGIDCEIAPNVLDFVLDPIREFSKETGREYFTSGKLEIVQSAVLGHFPQSGSSLLRDYEDLLKLGRDQLDSLVCFLSPEKVDEDRESFTVSGLGSAEKIDEDIEPLIQPPARIERDNFFLLPADSSQEQVILELNSPQNKGLVVWGPPGTGKSQTIVNIIADCLARNKSVLLVSEKRAALDVVYDRLADKKLTGLIAKVHHSKNDRKELFKKIADQLQQQRVEAWSHASEIHDPSEEIESIEKSLRDITLAYNDDRHGIKLGELYRWLGSHKEPAGVITVAPWKNSKLEDIEKVCLKLQTLQAAFVSGLRLKVFNNRPDHSSVRPDTTRKLVALLDVWLGTHRIVKAAYVTAQSGTTEGDFSAESFPPEATAEFEFLQQKLSQWDSCFKLFSRDYWKTRKEMRVLVKESKSCLENAVKEARELLPNFVSPEETESLIALLKSGLLDRQKFYELYGELEANFEDIRVFDLERNNLSSELQQCVKDFEALERARGVTGLGSWDAIFKQAVFTDWVRESEKNHPVIEKIRGGQPEALRKRYRELLDVKLNYSVQKLARKYQLTFGWPQAEKFHRELLNDVNKVRKALSVRKLTEKYFENYLFRNILPVWLASPETVSDVFLLKPGLFDVVIFDEASQCSVEHGLPSIYRGKQVIIAGDEKQLPPSSIFAAGYEEEDEEDSDKTYALEESSLLTLAKKTLRYKSHMLEWHYRSKHEELIQFSNDLFYNGRIRIAPNVVPWQVGNKPAISWYSVNGFWKENTNADEASKIVERIKYYLAHPDRPTFGVITFNAPQKELILDLIEKQRSIDPEFDALYLLDRNRKIDSQFFVKNIENVQGDEREVILFSVAYAKSQPKGRVNQMFGCLNKEGGENRLNVAITRAIKHIEIVCSFNPETDLDVSQCTSAGPRVLKNYLRFAHAVATEDYKRRDAVMNEINPALEAAENRRGNFLETPFESEVKNEIERLGYITHSQVGQSGFRIDLAIVHPENSARYLLAIECDGAQFHSSVTARERDVYRQKFLEYRGWKVHRVWSTNWWKNKDKEVKKIRIAIDEAMETKV